MAKSLALLKDLVQVRELQIVAVTSRLAQLNTGAGPIKTEIAGLDSSSSIDALLQQQPTVQALEAIQSARAEAQVNLSFNHLQEIDQFSQLMKQQVSPAEDELQGRLPSPADRWYQEWQKKGRLANTICAASMAQ